MALFTLGVNPAVADEEAITAHVMRHYMPDCDTLISFDTESSNNTLVEVGLVVYDLSRMVYDDAGLARAGPTYNICFQQSLSLDPEEKTNSEFWAKFPESFERIFTLGLAPEKLSLLTCLLSNIAKKSARMRFLARPAAYDFAVVDAAYKKLNIANPLGFGGTAKLVCAGNAVNALAAMYHSPRDPPSFETLFQRTDVKPCAHDAAGDAEAQAKVYFKVMDTARNVPLAMTGMLLKGPMHRDFGPRFGKFEETTVALSNLLRPEEASEKQTQRREPPTETQKREFAELLERLQAKRQRVQE